MASLFAKIRSSAVSQDAAIPGKIENPSHIERRSVVASLLTSFSTPLERLLLDAGPLRTDGSDKFFGMENFGNTCYCNSILQCLYYTVPFRDQVINYPKRSPPQSISTTPNGLPRINTGSGSAPGAPTPLSSTKPKSPAVSSARNPGGSASSPKPEDKEAPEFKKKVALAKGPVIHLNNENPALYGMPESLFTALKEIFESIQAHNSRTGVVSPTKFLEVLRKENEMFRSLMHQDAHEFLNLLLNEVVANVEVDSKELQAEKDKEMNGPGETRIFEKAMAPSMPNTADGTRTPSNTGWVHELFEGTLTSETKCLTCENVSQRDEVFLDLSVDLDQHSSVTSCLRKFSAEEMLCERNKFHCDRCGGLQEAEKRMKIKRLPKILALHLKRFKYTEDLQRLQKLFHRVVYPYHLRLFNTTDDAEDPDRLYELYAVVVHIGGGPYHGHYVSIVKTQDRGWLLFDDEMVEPVDKSFVRNFFGDRPGLACAYVLFYQETTLEAVKREQAAERPTEASQTVETPRESTGLGLRSGGVFANGIHLTKTPVSPTSEEGDRWDGLDKVAKVATEPPSLQSPSETANGASPLSPVLTSTKVEPQSRRERAKEEKERKAAEKEQGRADRARRKTLDLKKKDDKRQASEAKNSSESSKHGDDQTINPEVVKTSRSGSNGLAAGLSRFRQTSKSISKRPKFWTSKESKDETAVVDGDENKPPPTPNLAPPEKSKNRFWTSKEPKDETAVVDGDENKPPPAPNLAPPEKSKNRFWTSKESKDETAVVDGNENKPPPAPNLAPPEKSKNRFWTSKESKDETAVVDGDENKPPPAPNLAPPEKSKNRFSSLRKKTSSMLL
ncbi:hypothetical protein MMC07_007074 [Pseudocyphellaria aurata]|nr:hypothetical protein [Pseudocyphellaria aurata]